MSTMRIEHTHGMTVEQARERMGALGEYLENKHKIGVRWTDATRATISGKYVLFSFEGRLVVEERKVLLEGPDPGMMLRSKAREYLERKLAKYLDASTPVDALPRR